MKLKTDIYAIFHRFQALVEHAFSYKIKAIQNDLVGNIKKLYRLFVSLWINHLQLCAYTVNQNGQVERCHRHVGEIGFTKLAQASVPLKYWAPPPMKLRCSSINCMPFATQKKLSPNTLIRTENLNYSFLRVFCCLFFPYLHHYNK